MVSNFYAKKLIFEFTSYRVDSSGSSPGLPIEMAIIGTKRSLSRFKVATKNRKDAKQ